IVSTYVDTNATPNVTLRRQFNVLNVYDQSNNVDPNNLALGSTFDGGMIDPNRETITFAVPHNFLTGDRVVDEPGQGNLGTVPGLTSGATYYVVVIDPKTIQLVSTKDQALHPENYIKTFTPGNVSSNTITSLNNGFSPHEAVIYHSPAPQT